MSKNIAVALICIILGVMLAWQSKSVSYNKKILNTSNARLEDVMDDLFAEKANTENYRKKIQELENDIEGYKNTLGGYNSATEQLQLELDKYRMLAGLVDVKGKGVIITIDKTSFGSVQDTDILNVLNELRSSDVQAISINDERIIATSEVRSAGKYIMVNGRQLLPPFTIKAIADPDKIEYALKMVGGVVEKLELYQLKVKIDKSNEVVVPKYTNTIKIDQLTPVKP